MIANCKANTFGFSLLFSSLLVLCSGCGEEAAQVVEQVEESAAETAEAVQEEASVAGEKAKEVASELGEKVTAYLNPLKEKFGDLENLKDKPEELKEAVAGLIKSIEERAEGMELPEKLSEALATAKEKLVALKDYLEGEVEQAQVDEQIQGIMTSIKSQLGMGEES